MRTTTWWCRRPTASCCSKRLQGERKAPLVAGQSYTRQVGVEHNVINNTDHEVVFIEIELR